MIFIINGFRSVFSNLEIQVFSYGIYKMKKKEKDKFLVKGLEFLTLDRW